MDKTKTQVIESLKSANNVLVTVSNNPSVDQLAACIGFTLLVNKLGKHGTAVFSGEVPATIEFLQPESTLEKNTDSLRDFIISLDKSMADKLRYKVEDKLVRIFITPYRASIDEKDLVFSQGDFNVDAVIAIGVHKKEELDQAITAHGRILHDATVISVNTAGGADLGSIHWEDSQASSLSEMMADLGLALKKDILDSQMATAFLTGIVAETERFSNEKTTSDTMNMSATLMAAGANQQLVATKLQESTETEEAPEPEQEKASQEPQDQDQTEAKNPKESNNDDGALKIEHSESEEKQSEAAVFSREDKPPVDASSGKSNDAPVQPKKPAESSRLIMDPPSRGGRLTANTEPEQLDPSSDPLSLPAVEGRILSHKQTLPNPPAEQSSADASKPAASDNETSKAPQPKPQNHNVPAPTENHQSLADLERSVNSPHVAQQGAQEEEANQQLPNPDNARDAVEKAMNQAGSDSPIPKPIEALGAQSVELNNQEPKTEQAQSSPGNIHINPETGVISYTEPPAPQSPNNQPTDKPNDPGAPPPVPPPMMPPQQ